MEVTLRLPIKVFACDIDGCLVPLGHAAYDLAGLQHLVARNRESQTDPSVPALTLLSGRPHAYVDAMMQVLDVRLPAVFENGAGLATRAPYAARLLAAVDGSEAVLMAAVERLRERDDLFIQLGKVASLSVFDRSGRRTMANLADLLRALLRDHGLPLEVDPSRDCVNLLLPGVDKSAGLATLCRTLDLAPEAVAGIGDSDGDAGWLRGCGVSFAPVHAAPALRSAVTHVSRVDAIAATVEAYEALVRANRALGAAGNSG